MKELRNNAFCVITLVVTMFFVFQSTSFAQTSSNKLFTIVIDPGHGGKDSGTPGTGRYKAAEKDIALDVSLALGKKLTKELTNIKVIYTRTTDKYPTLQGRAVIANKADADLFISIHCNAQPIKSKKLGGKAYGSETFVLGLSKNATNLEVAKRENSVIFLEENYEEVYEGFDPNSPESLIALTIMQEEYLDQSIEIASYIEKEFVGTARRNSRGVKQNIFWVLAQTYMPSVLVELGFLTHLKEENFLNSFKGKEIMTLSLFKAIKKYKNKHFTVSNLKDATIISPIVTDKEVMFKVQIAASSRKLALKSYNFKGLKDLSKVKQGKLFKYFSGNTNNYNEIKKVQKIAKDKGYPKCFVVAYKDGVRVNLSTILKK